MKPREVATPGASVLFCVNKGRVTEVSIANTCRRPPDKSSPLARVTRRRPCPVCQKPDWCLVSPEGTGALCMRKASARPARRGGGWWHSFSVAPLPSHARPAPRPRAASSSAGADHIHKVLRALVSEHLTLSPRHRESLLARGLTPEVITRNGYASAPAHARAAEICSTLSRLGLEGVPGFYREGGAWRMAVTAAGFYIPVRDERGRVAGLQLRRDSGAPKYLWLSSANRPCGASSGVPPHFAGVGADVEELLVTEGALKADVISCLSGAAVVGLAGVQAFGDDFSSRLRLSFPRLRRAVVAYDRDLVNNPHVFSALERLISQLRGAFLQVRVRVWQTAHKGYDDFLLSRLTQGGAA